MIMTDTERLREQASELLTEANRMEAAPGAELRGRIWDELVSFSWANYGLDAVAEAAPEWAEALADNIMQEIQETIIQAVQR